MVRQTTAFKANAILFAVLSVLWTWYAGKDLNWDFFNYHFYGPYELINSRLDADYFAASIQSYLNPLGYVPLYLAIQSNWSPLSIAFALAIAHSLAFALLWLIADAITPKQVEGRVIYLFVAVLLGFLAPLQLASIGGSFLDPITAVITLLSLYLLTRKEQVRSQKHVFAIGLLAGAAAGLKLTNLLVLPALWLAMESSQQQYIFRRMVGRAIYFTFAVVVGIVATHGYWSVQLWREFGNPIFPLLNNIFASPDFPSIAFQDKRFIHDGFLSALMLPARMLEHRSWIYSEGVAPDIRPIALFGALLLLLMSLMRKAKKEQEATVEEKNSKIAFRGIVVFALSFYLIWAQTSRIGRYAHVLWLLLGPLMVASILRVTRKRTALVSLFLVVAVQLVFLYQTGNPRWTATKWDKTWIPRLEMPEELRNTPYLYLTLGTQTYSAFIPQFNLGSRFINIAGQYVQPAGTQMPRKLVKALSKDLPIKVIFGSKGGSPTSALRTDADSTLAPYGYKLLPGACHLTSFRLAQLKGYSLGESTEVKNSFAICDVEELSAGENIVVRLKLEKVDAVFNAIEDLCPKLLQPARLQTMQGRRGWMRSYFNTNAQLMSDGEIVLIRRPNEISDRYLGRFADWVGSNGRRNCGGVESQL